jgi:hypothetical protein
MSELLNLGAQIATTGAASGKMKVADMKIWQGGEPLKLELTIPIMDDAWIGANANGVGTNFNEALEILSSMCLPRNNTVGKNDIDKLLSSISYTPPPNPLNGTLKYSETVKDDSGNESTVKRSRDISMNAGGISCQLGGMLYAQNCVLTDMSVTYPNTKAMICHDYPSDKAISQNAGKVNLKYLTPIVAELKLSLETPFIMTQENYVNMLWLGNQASAANCTIDVDETIESIKKGVNTLINVAKG